MSTPTPTKPGGVFPVADHFPLGRPFGRLADATEQPASAQRPFGLSLAVRPQSITFDPSAVGYDEQRQIGLVREGESMVPLARHTDGTTNTQTNADGQSGPDSDTDHRED